MFSVIPGAVKANDFKIMASQRFQRKMVRSTLSLLLDRMEKFFSATALGRQKKKEEGGGGDKRRVNVQQSDKSTISEPLNSNPKNLSHVLGPF